MDSASGDLEGIASNMHDDALAGTNGNIDDAECHVVEDAAENVDGVIDDSCIDQVEDGHHHKYIEHIGEMARCSMDFVSINKKLEIDCVLFRISV